MFQTGPGGYPKLRGKAGQVRDLLPAMLSVWNEGMVGPVSRMMQQVKYALEASVECDKILADHPDVPCLPPAAAKSLFDHAALYAQLHSQLNNWGGTRVFNVTQKWHYLLHAALDARYINPRFTWCFQGEDYMAKMRQLMSTCARGVPAKGVAKKGLSKWLRFQHYSLEEDARI